MNEHPLLTARKLQKNRQRINDLKAKFEELKNLEIYDADREAALIFRNSLGIDEVGLAIQEKAAAAQERAFEVQMEKCPKEFTVIDAAVTAALKQRPPYLHHQVDRELIARQAAELQTYVDEYASLKAIVDGKVESLLTLADEMEKIETSNDLPGEDWAAKYSALVSQKDLLTMQIERAETQKRVPGIKIAGIIPLLQFEVSHLRGLLKDGFLNLFDSPFSNVGVKIVAESNLRFLRLYKPRANSAYSFDDLAELATDWIKTAAIYESSVKSIEESSGPINRRKEEYVVLVGECTCGCVRPHNLFRELGDMDNV